MQRVEALMKFSAIVVVAVFFLKHLLEILVEKDHHLTNMACETFPGRG